MVNRRLLLEQILNLSLPYNAVSFFLSYRLSESDLKYLKETALYVLNKIPPKEFNCASMSAMWAALLAETTQIPVQAVCGHLDWRDIRIFNYKTPIPVPDGTVTFNGTWDGHCWLEFGGLIADISLGRTVKYGKVKTEFRQFLMAGMGANPGLLCDSPPNFASRHLIYTPCSILNEQQINGLLNGIINGPE